MSFSAADSAPFEEVGAKWVLFFAAHRSRRTVPHVVAHSRSERGDTYLLKVKARLDGRNRRASLFLGSDSSASDMRFTYVFARNCSETVSHREFFCIVSL